MRKVYHFRTLKIALILFLGAPGFVAVSVWLLLQQPDNPFSWITSLVGMLFFGACFVLGICCIPRLFRDCEALVLTRQTLTIRNAACRQQATVHWDRICGFSELQIGGNRLISVHLHDPHSLTAYEPNGFHRLMMKIDSRYAGSPFNIPADLLQCDYEESLRTLRKYLKDHGSFAADTTCKQRTDTWTNPS